MAYYLWYRYTPEKACAIISACVVLHNKTLQFPVPECHCGVHCNHGNLGNLQQKERGGGNGHDHPVNLNRRLARDELVNAYFGRYVPHTVS